MRPPVIDGVTLNAPGGSTTSYSAGQLRALGTRFSKAKISKGILASDFGPGRSRIYKVLDGVRVGCAVSPATPSILHALITSDASTPPPLPPPPPPLAGDDRLARDEEKVRRDFYSLPQTIPWILPATTLFPNARRRERGCVFRPPRQESEVRGQLREELLKELSFPPSRRRLLLPRRPRSNHIRVRRRRRCPNHRVHPHVTYPRL